MSKEMSLKEKIENLLAPIDKRLDKIMQRPSSRGIVHTIDIKCPHCGGQSMYQEWVESYKGSLGIKRYGQIFCQDCDKHTKIYSERTPLETKEECVHEWKHTIRGVDICKK